MIEHSDDDALLSVVIAARNAGRWIDEALDSLLAQGPSVAEVLVVDNGSTDDTTERVAAAARSDPRVRLLVSTAPTAAAARNEGVAAATGEYLAFADADDIVPDGAYAAMLASLEASGSDVVIGDHLKFSATRTWSPTRRWYRFDEVVRAAAPEAVPELLSGRACWNRVFRRSAWDRMGLWFPEVQSVEDIQPMTRAFVEARSIDIVPQCVYLYRDRGDTTSLSLRADAAGTVRYLEQELACAVAVSGSPVLRAQHAMVVLDADGWAHLHRFLLTDPDAVAMATVARATAALAAALPVDLLRDVAPARRALWALVLQGDWPAARSFVLGEASTIATERIGAWIDAVARASRAEPDIAKTLAQDGLVPTLVNTAEEVDPVWLAHRLPAVAVVVPPSGAVLADAMTAAVGMRDPDGVRAVSALRHVVPLMVDRVEVTATGLVIGGPVDLVARGLRATLRLADADANEHAVAVFADGARWRAEVLAERVTSGRHRVSVSFAGVDGRFPVVTARMPLPPVADTVPMQPLADRKDGWRFLVDRRTPERPGLGSLLARIVRRLR
ncbi:MAG: hypothetical protein DI639_15190 [Leifsonia xyli]|nr:MAG: hypothetical protein DI639_15190 [Leifsonia xyli]